MSPGFGGKYVPGRRKGRRVARPPGSGRHPLSTCSRVQPSRATAPAVDSSLHAQLSEAAQATALGVGEVWRAKPTPLEFGRRGIDGEGRVGGWQVQMPSRMGAGGSYVLPAEAYADEVIEFFRQQLRLKNSPGDAAWGNG